LIAKISRVPRKGRARILKLIQPEHRELVVWWYGGIKKNQNAQTDPEIVVFFRVVESDGTLGDFVLKSIALTHLGLLRIGTIWKDGLCDSEIVLQKQNRIHVDFTPGAWDHVSPSQNIAGNPSLIPYDDYPLRYRNDKNWLLDFPIANGKNALVPCVEFLLRMYGRTAEVPRVLVTHGWKEVEKHFYVEFDQPVEPGTWPVKLKKRMCNNDAVFLAYAKYDSYARLVSKAINSQVQAPYQPSDNHAFIKVAPWFQERAQMKAKGIWINSGKTFLVLRLDGCSDPQGVPIQRDRENSNKVDEPAEGDGIAEAWPGAGAPDGRIMEIIDLTDTDEPDHGAVSVEIEEDDFEVIGTPREVIDVVRYRARTAGGKKGGGEKPDAYSTGEMRGTGKGVGHASIQAPQITETAMESKGMLRDMWDAMYGLQTRYPSCVDSVEWFTFENGYRRDATPRLIPLTPFEPTDKVLGSIKNWLYMDTVSKTLRGILVSKIMAGGKSVHIVEIQRRQREKLAEDGVTDKSEEAFSGLVFVLDEDADFEAWLYTLLSDIRHVKGILKNLSIACPGKMDDFRHSSALADEMPCDTAVLNALRKVGVILK
jgi:hypothetical protein